MMRRLMDRTGDRYGKLKVLGLSEWKPRGQSRWLCLCDCGKSTVVSGSNLIGGQVRSCGCLPRGRIKVVAPKRAKAIWKGMIQRCTMPKHRSWKHYGGRGISVCPAWLASFRFFWADMHEGYADDLQLDRIDSDGDYVKHNCRWTDSMGQGQHRRNNLNLEHDDKMQHLSEWARELGVSRQALHHRFKAGWSTEEILTLPIGSTPARRKK